MALVTCPDCGKNFSDKALACPECGCPTNVVLELLQKQNEESIVITDEEQNEFVYQEFDSAVEDSDKVNKDKQKKILSGIIVAITIFIISAVFIWALSNTNSDYDSDNIKTLSESDIKQIVVSTLYNKIDSSYKIVDPDSCKFNINKTENISGNTYVYGTVTLYDKYGNLTGKYGSGSAFCSFEIKITGSGSVLSCEID